jgi:hypothetical protein
VISLGTVAPKKFCMKGSPSMSSITESRAGRTRTRMVIGVSTDRVKVPGLTGASTLCQVITVKGLPSISFSTRSGLRDRLLSVKSLPVSVGRPLIEVTKPARMPTSMSTGMLSPT